MGIDSAGELWKKWKLETLDQEQAIGQILQHLVKVVDTTQKLTQQQRVVQRRMDEQAKHWAEVKRELAHMQSKLAYLYLEVQRLLKHTELPPQKEDKKG